VIAQAAEGTQVSDLKGMLRTLLSERFKLAAHSEARDVSGYAMVVTKKSPALHIVEDESVEENAQTVGGGGTVINGIKTSMSDFATWLSGPLGRPVWDMTGLTGRFDFSINYSPYLPADTAPTNDDTQRALLEAMRDRIGLKLERREGSLEMLIIDHLEKLPTEN
jgi:uncharacterized protein (TIGR03435 family)